MTTSTVVISFFFVCIAHIRLGETADKPASIADINSKMFENKLGETPMVVTFYKPGDAKNKELMPLLDKLGPEYWTNEKQTALVKINCEKEKALCKKQDIEETPTLKFYGKHHPEGFDHPGELTESAIREFIKEELEEDEKPVDSSAESPSDDKSEPSQDDKDQDTNSEEDDGSVLVLKDSTFKQTLANGYFFVKFYSPTCGFCVQLAPTWEKLAGDFSGDSGVTVAKVDCTKEMQVCQAYPINGFPTLHLIKNGQVYQTFQGARSPKALDDFILKHVKKAKKSKKNKKTAKKVAMATLTNKNFSKLTASGLWFIKFFSPHCGFCTIMADDWKKLGDAFKDNESINIGKINCHTEKKTCEQQNVWGMPGLWLYKDGHQYKEYLKDRNVDALSKFVKENLPKESKESKEKPKKEEL